MVNHSDFFGNGALAPSREVQIALSRKAYALVTSMCGTWTAALRFDAWTAKRMAARGMRCPDVMRPVLAAPCVLRLFTKRSMRWSGSNP